MKYFFILLLLSLSNYASAQNFESAFLDGELYVRFHEAPITENTDNNSATLELSSIPAIKALQDKYQIRELENSFSFIKRKNSTVKNIFRMKFEDVHKTDDLIVELQQLDIVDFAEKITIYTPSCIPNDPTYPNQYSLELINAEQAWCLPNQDTGAVLIGIVDVIFNVDHEDLKDNLVGAWDEHGGDGDVSTDNPFGTGDDHGTTVASICSAVTDNDTGLSSLGNNIDFWAIKAGTDNPFAIITRSAEGILRAAQEGADIINLSYSGPSDNFTVQMAINEAVDSFGCIIVGSAGNSNTDVQQYPAASDNVIAVAACDSEDKRWDVSSFLGSCYGDWVDITAPGVDIYTCRANNKYSKLSGTSYSSPMVAALLGLVWKANPALTRDEVINCVLSTTAPLDWSGGGSGRIDALAALRCALDLNTSSNDFNSLEQLSIYPNPTSNFIHLENKSGIVLKELLVYDVNGQLVLTTKSNLGNPLNISQLGTGVFYVKMIDDKDRSKVVEVVKI